MCFGQTPPLNLFNSSSHPCTLTLLYCIILFLLLASRILLIHTAALVFDRPSRLSFSIFLSFFLSQWIHPRGCVVARTGGLAVCVSECVVQMTGKSVSVGACARSHVRVCVISVVGHEVLTVPFLLQECSVILCLCQWHCHDRGEEKGTEREARWGEKNEEIFYFF